MSNITPGESAFASWILPRVEFHMDRMYEEIWGKAIYKGLTEVNVFNSLCAGYGGDIAIGFKEWWVKHNG